MTIEMTVAEGELLIACIAGLEIDLAGKGGPLEAALKDLRPLRSALLQSYLRATIDTFADAPKADKETK